MSTGSLLGRVAGWAMAPLFGLTSLTRQARTFHPRGPTYHAAVKTHPQASPELTRVGTRLVGPALVRFSGALWKHAPHTQDVLGCAVRFRRDDEETPEPASDDQDLLFATIKRPWTMPFAPITTDVEDYLANDYFAVSPFDIGLDERVYLRLHPIHASTREDGTRDERLAREVVIGGALLELEVSADPFGPWRPLLTVAISRVAHIDGEALRFRPFRDGRGVHPRGFIHALRVGTYALSQLARPDRTAY